LHHSPTSNTDNQEDLHRQGVRIPAHDEGTYSPDERKGWLREFSDGGNGSSDGRATPKTGLLFIFACQGSIREGIGRWNAIIKVFVAPHFIARLP